MRDPLDDLLDWLQNYNLWGQEMSERDAFTHFYKFQKMKFLSVPEEQWHIYFTRLVALERLFVVGNAVGGIPG